MLHVTIYNDDFFNGTQRCNVGTMLQLLKGNVATMFQRCVHNRRCELSRVSFYKSLSVARIVYLFIFWQISNPYPPQLEC